MKLGHGLIFASLGAILGGLVIQEYTAWFWAWGALFGGVVGWIGYDFLGFVRGIADAAAYVYREMKKERRRPRPLTKIEQSFQTWRFWSIQTVALSCVTLMFGYLALLFSVFAMEGQEPVPDWHSKLLITWTVLFGLGQLLAFSGYGLDKQRGDVRYVYDRYPTAPRDEELARDVRRYRSVVLFWNPIVAPFRFMYLFLFVVVPEVAKVLWLFVKTLYRFTFGSGRNACFIGASLGATVGHFMNDQLVVSGVVGALTFLLLHTASRFVIVKEIRAVEIVKKVD